MSPERINTKIAEKDRVATACLCEDARRQVRERPAPYVARRRRRRGYVLMETVVATGLLVAGLAVLGAKVQDAQRSVWMMRKKLAVLRLAEQHLAEYDLGLIKLDTVDEVQDGDFGPRYPNYGWLLTIDQTAIDNMFLLRLDVFYHLRDGVYKEDEFDFDKAELVHSVYAMRATPEPVDFETDFGLNEEEVTDLSEKLRELAIPGIDPNSFDPALFGKLDFRELLEAMPVLLDAFGLDVTQIAGALPPGLLDQLRNSGVLDAETEAALLGEPLGDDGSQDEGGRP